MMMLAWTRSGTLKVVHEVYQKWRRAMVIGNQQFDAIGISHIYNGSRIWSLDHVEQQREFGVPE